MCVTKRLVVLSVAVAGFGLFVGCNRPVDHVDEAFTEVERALPDGFKKISESDGDFLRTARYAVPADARTVVERLRVALAANGLTVTAETEGPALGDRPAPREEPAPTNRPGGPSTIPRARNTTTTRAVELPLERRLGVASPKDGGRVARGILVFRASETSTVVEVGVNWSNQD